MNGEPWEGRAYLTQDDSCSGYEVVVAGELAGGPREVSARFHLADLVPGATPIVDVRTSEGYRRDRCLAIDDTTFVSILMSFSADVADGAYASTPIAGVMREFVVDEATPERDRVAGTFSLSARLWDDGEPPQPSVGRPDTLLLEDVAFDAPLW